MEYRLRKFNEKDVNNITKYANNKNIAKWLTNEFPHPYSEEDAETFINIVSNENPIKTFTIEVRGEACGAISVNPIEPPIKEIKEKINKKTNKQTQDTIINICDKQAELGYWLAEKYWNLGIISSAIKKMVEYGFETFDIDCIFATPFLKNKASAKVLKKAGFKTDFKKRKIIKNNEIYEVIIFSTKK